MSGVGGTERCLTSCDEEADVPVCFALLQGRVVVTMREVERDSSSTSVVQAVRLGSHQIFVG